MTTPLEKSIYRTALAAIALAAGLAFWHPVLAQGFVAGAAAGVLGFSMIARFLRRAPEIPAEQFQQQTFRQGAARMAVYAVCFALAYRIDPQGFRGMLGALAGYVLVRTVLTAVAWRQATQPVKPTQD